MCRNSWRFVSLNSYSIRALYVYDNGNLHVLYVVFNTCEFKFDYFRGHLWSSTINLCHHIHNNEGLIYNMNNLSYVCEYNLS